MKTKTTSAKPAIVKNPKGLQFARKAATTKTVNKKGVLQPWMMIG